MVVFISAYCYVQSLNKGHAGACWDEHPPVEMVRSRVAGRVAAMFGWCPVDVLQGFPPLGLQGGPLRRTKTSFLSSYHEVMQSN